MAAKTVLGNKGSVRKVKTLPVKTSLNNPYTIQWNTVGGEDMQFILQTLQEKFKHLGLQKIEAPNRQRKYRCTKKGILKDQANERDTNLEGKEEMEGAGEKACLEDAAPKPGWTNFDLRKELAIGINEVTRALEKNELYLVLVCKSAKPAMITMHLIELSASRAVPACQVPRLSENLAPALGLKSVLALGFRTNSSHFVDEVRAIKERVPPLHVSWLNRVPVNNETNPCSLPKEEQINVAMEVSMDESRKNLKRKQGESCIKASRTTDATAKITLEPLKIKKLVPNPNKVRKPPKIKKKVSKK